MVRKVNSIDIVFHYEVSVATVTLDSFVNCEVAAIEMQKSVCGNTLLCDAQCFLLI